MYDWIIESDIVRLQKQLKDEQDPAERQRLQLLLNAKRRQLPNAPAMVVTERPAPRGRWY